MPRLMLLFLLFVRSLVYPINADSGVHNSTKNLHLNSMSMTRVKRSLFSSLASYRSENYKLTQIVRDFENGDWDTAFRKALTLTALGPLAPLLGFDFRDPFKEGVLKELKSIRAGMQKIWRKVDTIVDETELRLKLQELYGREKDVSLFEELFIDYAEFTTARKDKFLSDCVHLDMNQRFYYFYRETTDDKPQTLIEILKKTDLLNVYKQVFVRVILSARAAGKLYLDCLETEEKYRQIVGQAKANKDAKELIDSRLREMKRRIEQGSQYIMDNFWPHAIRRAREFASNNEGADNHDFAVRLYESLTEKYSWRILVAISWDKEANRLEDQAEWKTDEVLIELETNGRNYALVHTDRDYQPIESKNGENCKEALATHMENKKKDLKESEVATTMVKFLVGCYKHVKLALCVHDKFKIDHDRYYQGVKYTNFHVKGDYNTITAAKLWNCVVVS